MGKVVYAAVLFVIAAFIARLGLSIELINTFRERCAEWAFSASNPSQVTGGLGGACNAASAGATTLNAITQHFGSVDIPFLAYVFWIVAAVLLLIALRNNDEWLGVGAGGAAVAATAAGIVPAIAPVWQMMQTLQAQPLT